MRYISEENLRKWILTDNCDDGCGYIDERDLESMEWEEITAESQAESEEE